MDSEALNYNPAATVNSEDWCVLPVPGCMLELASTRTKGRYSGKSSNFDASATVSEGCVTEILGCMDSEAANYDPAATVNFKCFTEKFGCLNPLALNFNCSGVGEVPCEHSITNHSKGACLFYVPTVDTGGAGLLSGSVTLTTTGDVSSVTDSQKDALAAYMASQVAGTVAADFVVTVAAGSIVWTITLPELDPEQYAEFKAWEETALVDTTTAQAVMESAGITEYSVTAVSVTQEESVSAFAPPSSPPGAGVGVIVGAVVGAVVGVLIIGGIVVFLLSKKKKAVTPAQQ